MRLDKVATALLLSVFSILNVVAQTDAGQTQSLGDIARQLRQQKAQIPGAAPSGGMADHPAQKAPAPSAPAEPLGDSAHRLFQEKAQKIRNLPGREDYARAYDLGIRELFAKKDFQALDEAADQARQSKSRLPGGTWTLFEFYDAIAKPLRGEQASDQEWQAHIATLTLWTAQRPLSITGRVALANGYLGYGWQARGNGFSDKVSDDGWELLEERTKLAFSTLVEADKLSAKCPYWFEAMQNVSLSAGFGKNEQRSVFEKAVKFEPNYYHFYREYANSLLPKWGGEPGEAEAFAEQAYQRVGGKQGAFIYFEIASVINCDCSEDFRPLKMSWPRIKEGYDFMTEQYGTTNLKRNRLTLMAVQQGDRSVAQEMFSQIGDAWDRQTWKSRTHFDVARQWATTPQP